MNAVSFKRVTAADFSILICADALKVIAITSSAVKSNCFILFF
jgi:hypothetical protein